MPSPTSKKYTKAKIGVFWDVKECPIPNGLDPASISKNIKSALAKKGYLGEITITPYCNKNQFPDGPDDFESAGMKLKPAGDESQRYKTMSYDICFWSIFDREKKYTNLMVISGDNMDFLYPLESFKKRNPVNILLAQPEKGPRWCRKCRKPLEDLVAESGEWFWESLAAGGDSITKAQREELLGNKEVEDGNTDCC
ncbi:unnamed protein product [Eruca vesicaria subsp. sativa]|uniref:NYN domain-containing protein n=1 Tax=Eruca vesicaria subsp. sativa TaxID=29727 RepID=A0ABC8J358_ERUVS|nr:unnamed protein product [Eruca vesicaria subsp. sativa]